MGKDHLDGSSIGKAVTEHVTNVSDTEDNLEVENNTSNELLVELCSFVHVIMASVAHARNYKSISTDVLCKI